MSENTRTNGAYENPSANSPIVVMVLKNFGKLPDVDQKMFYYGPWYLGGNAGLVGMIANSLYRRALNVRKLGITSTLSMFMGPLLTTQTVYSTAMYSSLLSGDLCHMCAMMRGAFIGAICGAVYPIILALPLSMSIGGLYDTTLIPPKGHRIRHAVDLAKPILRKMKAVIILQGFFGGYLGSRHFESYAKLVKLSYDSDGEELKD